MSRPVTKAYLGEVTTEVRLGDLRPLLWKEAEAEGIYMADLIRRELARFVSYRGHPVDRRLLDPQPIRRRLLSALSA